MARALDVHKGMSPLDYRLCIKLLRNLHISLLIFMRRELKIIRRNEHNTELPYQNATSSQTPMVKQKKGGK